ncbi:MULTISPECIES: DUF2283 domain-containing protein [unclassified Corynebacterium]|uniref:DUF2283 domain-containing protein n=1 Tax=unclassified Corynebacterium TaxID=2624378 RepID=UPI0029CA4988|nr:MULTISPECIES: DUF2283 domain-containing protein [unclassified Corynebacterium]WPF66414.1 DUF2283 domain-containing protein [Corynebacterium sp. 22KM0430]WPF68904.1 DUF2283 domain-containing protein [Corynebacterium sp. 21KM1197]
MHLRYDAPSDTALLSLSSAPASSTADMTVRCHFDAHGRLLAIEIPHVSRLLPAGTHRVKLAPGRPGTWTIINTSSETLHEVMLCCPDARDEQGRTFAAAWEGIPPGDTREFSAPLMEGERTDLPAHAEVTYLIRPQRQHHREKIAWEQE